MRIHTIFSTRVSITHVPKTCKKQEKHYSEKENRKMKIHLLENGNFPTVLPSKNPICREIQLTNQHFAMCRETEIKFKIFAYFSTDCCSNNIVRAQTRSRENIFSLVFSQKCNSAKISNSFVYWNKNPSCKGMVVCGVTLSSHVHLRNHHLLVRGFFQHLHLPLDHGNTTSHRRSKIGIQSTRFLPEAANYNFYVKKVNIIKDGELLRIFKAQFLLSKISIKKTCVFRKKIDWLRGDKWVKCVWEVETFTLEDVRIFQI